MESPNNQAEKHVGETKGVPNYIHDLVHDLSNRLDAVWRYDQYMANAQKAEGTEAGQLWSDLRNSELQTIDKLKKLLHQALHEEVNQSSSNK